MSAPAETATIPSRGRTTLGAFGKALGRILPVCGASLRKQRINMQGEDASRGRLSHAHTCPALVPRRNSLPAVPSLMLPAPFSGGLETAETSPLDARAPRNLTRVSSFCLTDLPRLRHEAAVREQQQQQQQELPSGPSLRSATTESDGGSSESGVLSGGEEAPEAPEPQEHMQPEQRGEAAVQEEEDGPCSAPLDANCDPLSSVSTAVDFEDLADTAKLPDSLLLTLPPCDIATGVPHKAGPHKPHADLQGTYAYPSGAVRKGEVPRVALGTVRELGGIAVAKVKEFAKEDPALWKAIGHTKQGVKLFQRATDPKPIHMASASAPHAVAVPSHHAPQLIRATHRFTPGSRAARASPSQVAREVLLDPLGMHKAEYDPSYERGAHLLSTDGGNTNVTYASYKGMFGNPNRVIYHATSCQTHTHDQEATVGAADLGSLVPDGLVVPPGGGLLSSMRKPVRGFIWVAGYVVSRVALTPEEKTKHPQETHTLEVTHVLQIDLRPPSIFPSSFFPLIYQACFEHIAKLEAATEKALGM